MRSIRRVLVIATAVAALAAAAPSTMASQDRSFHVVKDCDGLTCVITSSSYKGIPSGSVINYTENEDFSLTAVISVAHGTATGHCVLDPIFGDPSLPGSCVFSTGTGTLTQFRLVVDVTTSDFVTWYWDGTYRIGSAD
jgi:hypothetical protein